MLAVPIAPTLCLPTPEPPGHIRLSRQTRPTSLAGTLPVWSAGDPVFRPRSNEALCRIERTKGGHLTSNIYICRLYA
jgi:hypothetical protein